MQFEAQPMLADLNAQTFGGRREKTKRIRAFEAMGVPVDVYGVGSSLFANCSENGTNNDFTADIVRVKLDGQWVTMAKVGRRACDVAHKSRRA